MKKRPNIIIINPDEMRWDTMGHMGNPAASTPRLDAFAREDAVSFENAFCQNPVCVPSRCSFLSGLYPHTTGHRTMHFLQREDEPNILRTMKDAGYEVIWVGRNDVIPGTRPKTAYCDEYYDGISPENQRDARIDVLKSGGLGHGTAGGCGIEIEIDRNQEIAGADVGGAAAGDGVVVFGRAEIGTPRRVGDLLGKGFVLPCPAYCEVLALRLVCGGLVAVAGYAEFGVEALCKLAGERCAFLQSDARYGNQRQDVGGAAARMGAVVLAHIYQFLGLGGAAEGGFADGVGLADECYYCAVSGFARVDIQDLDAFHACDCGGYGIDYLAVASLAEIGDAFDYPLHS